MGQGGREARRPSSCEEGAPERPAPPASDPRPTRAGTIRLPPLSSPRGGPPRERVARGRARQTATCAPREEDTLRRSRPGGRLPARACPRIAVGNVGHRPVVHRLRLRPLHEAAGRRTAPAPPGQGRRGRAWPRPKGVPEAASGLFNRWRPTTCGVAALGMLRLGPVTRAAEEGEGSPGRRASPGRGSAGRRERAEAAAKGPRHADELNPAGGGGSGAAAGTPRALALKRAQLKGDPAAPARPPPGWKASGRPRLRGSIRSSHVGAGHGR